MLTLEEGLLANGTADGNPRSGSSVGRATA
jgi:hypothetical protein